jgi:hypothetical protein
MKKILIALIILLAVFIGVTVYKRGDTLEHRIDTRAEDAAKTGDITKCDSLPTIKETSYDRGGEQVSGTEYPRDTCLQNYLRATNDKGTCDKMTNAGNKEYCYNYLAEVYSDPSWCNKLDSKSPAYWKTSVICKAIATLKIEDCSPLDDPQLNPPRFAYSPKTDCITEIVKRTHNYKNCGLINGPSYGLFETSESKNECLKYAGCELTDRQDLCSMMQYPTNTIPQIKKQCLTEKWSCWPVPKRVQ